MQWGWFILGTFSKLWSGQEKKKKPDSVRLIYNNAFCSRSFSEIKLYADFSGSIHFSIISGLLNKIIQNHSNFSVCCFKDWKPSYVQADHQQPQCCSCWITVDQMVWTVCHATKDWRICPNTCLLKVYLCHFLWHRICPVWKMEPQGPPVAQRRNSSMCHPIKISAWSTTKDCAHYFLRDYLVLHTGRAGDSH